MCAPNFLCALVLQLVCARTHAQLRGNIGVDSLCDIFVIPLCIRSAVSNGHQTGDC